MQVERTFQNDYNAVIHRVDMIMSDIVRLMKRQRQTYFANEFFIVMYD